MAESFWSNVQVDVQTASGTALTVSAITKANPGVVTYTGTDPTNGDVVYLAVTGMNQVNKRAFRVANVNGAANTFELEDEDTTLYETFVSGTATPVTLGTSMSTVQDVDGSGGEPNFRSISTIHELVEREVPTSVSPFRLTFGCLWDPTDAAHVELRKASLALTTRVVRLRFSNGVQMLGLAYVSALGVPTGTAQDVVKTPIAFAMQGLPTIVLP